MEYRQTIIGDTLTWEESQYEGEYIAKWRGLTVATAAKVSQGLYAGQYAVTEWHPDQESTYSPDYVSSLDAAWRHIKAYCRGDFDDALREMQGRGGGLHR